MGCVSTHVSVSQARKAVWGIGFAPVSTGILSSSTGSSTIGCTVASSRLDEAHEFWEFCNPSTRTHEFCASAAGTHDYCEFCYPSTRTHDSGVFCYPTTRTHDLVNLQLVRMTFVNHLHHMEVISSRKASPILNQI